MENTNEIHTYMSTVPFEFEEWLPYLDNEKLKSVVPDGRAMLHINKKYITNAVRRGEERLIKIQGNNIVQRVVFCNSTELKSDIGHSLLERFAYSNFSAVYSMHNKSCSISLRSSDDRTDVEYISREFFSGGGHRNASACKNTTNNLPDTITLGRGDLCNAIDNAKLNILNLDNTIVQTIIINLTRVNFEKKIDMDDILKYLTQYREGSAIKEYQYLLKQKKKLESIDTVIVLRLFKKNVSTFIICFSDNSIKKFFDDYCSVHNNFEKFVLTPFSTMIEVNGDKHDLTFLKDL